MRIRTIKPEFFKDEQLAELSPLARILFIGLWGLADRDGRLEDRPTRIKVEVLPYDDHDIDMLLNELADHREKFIIRYEAEGKSVIQVRTFEKHQRINGKEAAMASLLPKLKTSTGKQWGSNGEATGKQRGSNGEAPVQTEGDKPKNVIETPINIGGSNGEATGKQRGSNGEATGKHPESQEGKGKEGKGREGVGVGREEATTTTTTMKWDWAKNQIKGCRPEYRNLADVLIENELKDVPEEFWTEAIADFVRDQTGALQAENNPLKVLRGYLYYASTKTKKDAAGKTSAVADPNQRMFVSQRPAGAPRIADLVKNDQVRGK